MARADFLVPKDAVTLRLTLVRANRALRVTPFLVQGEAVMQATAKEWFAAEGEIPGHQEGGATWFRGLPAGRYTLFAVQWREKELGVLRQVVDLTPGEQQLEVKVPEGLTTIPLELNHFNE